ncbi:MAG: SAM-dependent methyltransferase [Candidatus Aenigmatarchaeota archaeon]|nr:MAG: SAM-dependent methyltransferase [Candidatus Aenigmarchaeota archaeon]
MAKIESFDKYSKEYEEWFVKNQDIYQAELNVIKSLVPFDESGVEIGVGSGRFALTLGIKVGVEPSNKMAEISRKKGIHVYEAVTEQLPFNNKTFDFALMVTTICFIDDLVKSFQEAYRVLKNDGFIVVGFVDKESELGKQYQLKKEASRFYRNATFYSVNEVMYLLTKAHFEDFLIKQTVFSSRSDELNHVKNGYDKGSFVAIKAKKSTNLEGN